MFKCELVGDEKFRAKISGLIKRVQNPTRAMEFISNAMRRDVLEHFDDESGPSGGWPDLKAATWAWKAKHGHTNMLQNTGNLRQRNMPDHTATIAKVVNDAAYAGAQNFGEPGHNLPSRKFMWLSKGAMKNIIDLMRDYLMEGM